MHLHQHHPVPRADARVGGDHCLRVVARGPNGQPRTYRLAPSAEQHTAYRRLALAILGLDLATLTDTLRSDRTSAPLSAGGLPRLSPTGAIATTSA